jgi:hypothetical protein
VPDGLVGVHVYVESAAVLEIFSSRIQASTYGLWCSWLQSCRQPGGRGGPVGGGGETLLAMMSLENSLGKLSSTDRVFQRRQVKSKSEN